MPGHCDGAFLASFWPFCRLQAVMSRRLSRTISGTVLHWDSTVTHGVSIGETASEGIASLGVSAWRESRLHSLPAKRSNAAASMVSSVRWGALLHRFWFRIGEWTGSMTGSSCGQWSGWQGSGQGRFSRRLLCRRWPAERNRLARAQPHPIRETALVCRRHRGWIDRLSSRWCCSL